MQNTCTTHDCVIFPYTLVSLYEFRDGYHPPSWIRFVVLDSHQPLNKQKNEFIASNYAEYMYDTYLHDFFSISWYCYTKPKMAAIRHLGSEVERVSF